jgi:phosphohistidine phosphatase
MKTLHLLRHAKSDWANADLGDHERPLNARGTAAAKAMGSRLASEDFRVDAIFCSTATRARETYQLLVKPLPRIPATFHDELYMVSPGDLLAFIRSVADTHQSIMLIGHNPATHALALSMIARAATGAGKSLAALKEKYSTGALCTIGFEVAQWREVSPGKGSLVRYLRPKDLTAASR